MSTAIRRVLEPVASLRLTVTLFALSIVLIFAGTLAQVDDGIWTVLSKHFRSYFTFLEFQLFFPRSWDVPGGIPFPGGWMLGSLLLANLLAAHLLRFELKARGVQLFTGLLLTLAGIAIIAGSFIMLMSEVQDETGKMWSTRAQIIVGVGTILGSGMCIRGCIDLFAKRAGIVLLHAGIIIMLLSELVTGLYAVETSMPITEGSYTSHAADIREVELAVIESADDKTDRVLVVPQSMLLRHRPAAEGGSGQVIHDPLLPFDIQIERYDANAVLLDAQRISPEQESQLVPSLATQGLGLRARVKPVKTGTGTDSGGDVDRPAAYVTLLHKGVKLGTYLLWVPFDRPQDEVEVDGKKYQIALRFRRHYMPMEMHLLDVKHDVFIGTNIPRNFSSRIRLVDRERNEDREVLIYMNHPLRYRGWTFFQSQVQKFDEDGQMREGTVLAVVRNPAWLWPYVSCAMVAAGMLVHFGEGLGQFLKRRMKW